MFQKTGLLLLLVTGSAVAQTGSLAPLFDHAWRIAAANPAPAPGSIYVFLHNGTLLETSCVETYRIATWSIDPAAPRTINVTEDGRPAFAASLISFHPSTRTRTKREPGSAVTYTVGMATLHLKQTLLPGNQARDLTLTSINKEFTCPAVPR